nr:MAG TPA: hypothetical protein [Caudoviricetes sp.]
MIANPLYKIPCKAFQAFPLLIIGQAIIITDFFGLRFVPFPQFIGRANISKWCISCYNSNPAAHVVNIRRPTFTAYCVRNRVFIIQKILQSAIWNANNCVVIRPDFLLCCLEFHFYFLLVILWRPCYNSSAPLCGALPLVLVGLRGRFFVYVSIIH